MKPIINQDQSSFHFNSQLSDEEITIVESSISLQIIEITSEGIDINLEDGSNMIEFKGDIAVRYSSKQSDISFLFIHLTSLYDEIFGPVVDMGAVLIKKIERKSIPLKEKIRNPPPPLFDKPMKCNFRYPIASPVQSILFYGNHEDETLSEVEWKDLKEYYKKLTFSEPPRVISDSVEFIIFEHENERRSILKIVQHGFIFQSEALGHDLSLRTIKKDYIWAEKNITLKYKMSN